jgi:hypothetical protein
MLNLIDKHVERWGIGYLRHLGWRALTRRPQGLRHLLFALCDHYEPLWRGANEQTGATRVFSWLKRYEATLGVFRDADGRMPQHSWFFPGEEYRPTFLDALAQLAASHCGEVELHLHHDRDTPAVLTDKIRRYLSLLAEHGHLCRDADGRARYAFIHGNWALANGRPDGRWCGVDSELQILFETGCYADFTFPSCPDPTQPGMVNVIYWPTGNLGRRRAYERGIVARTGQHFDDRVLMVTGPLGVALRQGTLRPRLEYGDVTAQDPPTADRVRSWIAQDIHVRGRPDWVFTKVYTHGAQEPQTECILGPGGVALHRALTREFNDGTRWKLHYVTAREMFNIARAAMDGRSGDPSEFRDYLLPPPPASLRAQGDRI